MIRVTVKGAYAEVTVEAPEDEKNFWAYYSEKLKVMILQCGEVVKTLEKEYHEQAIQRINKLPDGTSMDARTE